MLPQIKSKISSYKKDTGFEVLMFINKAGIFFFVYIHCTPCIGISFNQILLSFVHNIIEHIESVNLFAMGHFYQRDIVTLTLYHLQINKEKT